MRWKATLAGVGLVLIAGTACAGQANQANPQPAAGQQPSSSAAPASPSGEAGSSVAPPAPRGPGLPVQPPVMPPPAAGRDQVPPVRIDSAALPKGYPRDVSVSADGRTLMIKAEEGGCGHASAEPKEQSDNQVVVNLVETTARTHQMCTMDIRYPVVSVTLDAPLGNRMVVLHSEQRKI